MKKKIFFLNLSNRGMRTGILERYSLKVLEMAIFLLISSLVWSAASGQILFDVTRSNSPSTWNILNLTCENIGSGPPLFFKGTERVDVPDPTAFQIDRSLEGNYTCGVENEFGRSISQQSITIVGEYGK